MMGDGSVMGGGLGGGGVSLQGGQLRGHVSDIIVDHHALICFVHTHLFRLNNPST